ncbi:MAG: inositol monophosphatase family protein [Acidihalobacter sp.]|jgi:myo-inositol-1(or 4)-monophosphatase|uniref:inositol monophosphatase family protein n=1 Tax=Acidihalobacter sp. TaxID=1872108 RepID=UPI00307ED81B
MDIKTVEALLAQTGREELLPRLERVSAQRNLGTCALEWVWLAAGRGHVYLHGGVRLWDYAAGSLLSAEVGGVSATLEGEPVFQPDPGPRSVLAAADPALFEAWQRELAVASTLR